MEDSQHKSPDNIRVAIKKVKQIASFINESLYQEGSQKAIIEFQSAFEHNGQNKTVSFTLRTFCYYVGAEKSNFFFDLHVQNIFEIPELSELIAEDGALNLPMNVISAIVGLAISHSRVYFCQNLAGTVYNDLMLPISDPTEMANKLLNIVPS